MSAAFSPDFINGINPGGGALDQGQMAVLAGFATALGGGTAALAGANVDGAVSAAMNEAMNNSGELWFQLPPVLGGNLALNLSRRCSFSIQMGLSYALIDRSQEGNNA